MLQGIDLGNLAIGIAIGVIAIAVMLGLYGVMNIGIYIWEKLTGNALENAFPDWLPWHNKKS